MKRFVLFIGMCIWTAAAFAQTQNDTPQRQPSTCLAIAQNIHSPDLPVHYAKFSQPVQAAKYDVIISYQGHSTYLIESPGGTKIATDFAGWLTDPVTPDAVTMNQAHSSHYTEFPDPNIKHVLRGWGTGDVARAII